MTKLVEVQYVSRVKRSTHLAKRPKLPRSGLSKPKTKYRLTRYGKRAKGLESLSALMKKADAIFSQYIRQKYADKDGLVKSYTGNEVKHWKKMHCGHYLSRSYKATRWDENNARPQSPAENIWKHGNPIEFRINLVEEIGDDLVKELEQKRHDIFRPTRQFYEDFISVYQEKLRQLNNS